MKQFTVSRWIGNCHGSWVPGPVLTVSCLYACAYVWAGVCGCVWLRLIRSSWESSPLGYISSCHALSLVRSLQFAVDVYEAFLVPGFRDSWALLLSWTPIAGDSSAHCFPALPASATTESSVSAYGKLRFCLRRAPRLPTEAPPLCLRRACDRRIWPIFMDSAETRGLQELLAGNNARMDLQEEKMLNTGRAVQALVAQVSELTTQVQLLRSPAAPPTPPSFSIPGNHSPQHEPRLPAPEMYAGDPNLCRAFLTKCSLFFSLQPLTFATEVSRVALVLTLLSGKAALWGTAVWENRHPCCSSFHSLSQEMRRVFDRALVGREAARMLADLRQGEQSVSDYSIQFRTLAAECEWNGKAQWDMFLHGLADRIHQEIDVVELPLGLDELVDLALRVDARLQQRDLRGRRKLTPRYPFFDTGDTVGHSSVDEPMQVGRARLSREERDRRKDEGTMFILWRGWPFPGEVPRKRPGPTVGLRLLSGGVSLNKASSTTLLPVRLQWAAERHEGTALLDSGAEGNLLDISLAQLLHIPLVPLRHKISVSALNGQSLPQISLSTVPITLVTSGNHSETITFLVTHSPLAPVVLGHPWLTQHNPRVDWGRNTVLEWSRACYASCLVSAGFSVCDSVLQEEMGNLSNVPRSISTWRRCSVSPGPLLSLLIVPTTVL